MAPPPHPTSADHFFARYQAPLLGAACASQFCHWQIIKRQEPAVEFASGSISWSSFPRPLRAGLGWAAVFLVILTKTSLAKKALADFRDPVISQAWKRKEAGKLFQEEHACVNSDKLGDLLFFKMSADFWAGYISGAVGILIGNPLDLLKVRLQAGNLEAPATATTSSSIPQASAGTAALPRARISYTSQFSTASSLIRGASAPILGYGALNALLFMTYNRTSSLLTYGSLTSPQNSSLAASEHQPTLWTTFISGALGGLATWVISTPTELIKCRAQTAKPTTVSSQTTSPSIHTTNSTSSYAIARSILAREGIRGLYFGGVVTALRDSIGYGFYFWSYELSTRLMVSRFPSSTSSGSQDGNGNGKSQGDASVEAMKVLLCGGLAGVITWASVFPLDVIKTRVQTQIFSSTSRDHGERGSLLGGQSNGRAGAIEVARNAYRNEGVGVFFRGLGICSVRAFIVNAAQWAVYEWIMRELDPSRRRSAKRVEE